MRRNYLKRKAKTEIFLAGLLNNLQMSSLSLSLKIFMETDIYNG